MSNRMQIEPYASLKSVLDGAFEQCANGKGVERHAYGDDEPFEKQLICEMGRRLGGPSGPCYQAVKKIYEADRLPPEKAIHELYGAINYIAAAIVLIQEKQDQAVVIDKIV